jgi:CHAD domain-containing protein
MTFTVPMPSGNPAKYNGLEVWMGRVPDRADQVRHGWDADAVHDLRVALRRCRTMSDALSKVNPGPGWRKLKKTTRELFHDLGNLRDTQVERSWVKKLGPAGDPVRKHMLRLLSREEQTQGKAAEQALDRFDRKDWRKLTRKLASKARFFPLESVVFQRLALESLHEAVGLYQQARKRRSSIAWHQLRIEIKNFRYIVENFLPHRYEVWADDLKRMQDLLGDVHDLDVLRTKIRRHTSGINPAIVAVWLEKIGAQRKARLDEFLSKASSENSSWAVWRAGFRWGHELRAASFPERRTA